MGKFGKATFILGKNRITKSIQLLKFYSSFEKKFYCKWHPMIILGLIWVGFSEVRFEWGEGKITPVV